LNNKIVVFLTAVILSVPGIARAEGTVVGTDAYALVADGIGNVFYQGKVSDNGAVLVEFASDANINLVQGSYKIYFSGKYANAPYIAPGFLYATNGSSSITGFVGKIGYDFTVGNSFVLSPYYGVINVSGYTGGGIGFNVGIKF